MSEFIDINTEKICDCNPKSLNCQTPKDWLNCQIGVWQFNYEKRDIRDKNLHPATFPISMAKRVIQLFSHKGELIVDPFVGSGTTLVAAKDLVRNAVGFDINSNYISLCQERLNQLTFESDIIHNCKQIAICDDARNINKYLKEGSIKCIFTSPPYANILNRKRTNKSRIGAARKNEQFGKVEQYSQMPNDLGILDSKEFELAIFEIFNNLRPLLKTKGHCVINISDIWMDNKRIPLHICIVNALQKAGYELRNTIIWDRTNIVNKIGIFGWPSNYITMGTTFEYILDFVKA
jgi:DNA modification methylase